METDRYKVSSSKYINNIFKPLMFRWLGWLFLILFIPLFFLSFYDFRFVLVLLMVLFLVVPLILSFTYIIHGFKPEAKYSLLEKSVEFMDSTIKLKFNEDKTETIRFSEIKNFKINKQDIILYCKRESPFIFIIPLNTFKSESDKKEAFKFLEHLDLS